MFYWSLFRSGPPRGPATNHRKADVAGGADLLRDLDSTLLCDGAAVLGGGAAGAAAATPPTAPSPTAPRRCSPTHTHLEASE